MPLLLDTPEPMTATPPQRMAKTQNGYGYLLKGGATAREPSPWSCALVAHLPGLPTRNVAFTTWSHLHLTFPIESLSTSELRAHFDELLRHLRVQWSTAGLGLSRITRDGHRAFDAARAAVLRFPGLDYTHQTGWAWHDRVRSVSWLTAIGAAMRDRVLALPTLAEDGVYVDARDEALVLVAGDAPERGDLNRLRVPEPYRRVDRCLRQVRAREASFAGR